jgi:ABC-type molybdenum transport system ATPase subunit/photorepair protein PhrA
VFEARALTKRYNGLLAVDQVSFTIRRGEVGYLGPNGSGKTSTINMIVGLRYGSAFCIGKFVGLRCLVGDFQCGHRIHATVPAADLGSVAARV